MYWPTGTRCAHDPHSPAALRDGLRRSAVRSAVRSAARSRPPPAGTAPQEFRHWLGGSTSALNVVHLKQHAANVAVSVQLQLLAHTPASSHCIVLISYEGLVQHGKYLCAGAGVDLLVADEAHGLAHESQRANAVRCTPARARILITATPLSNDLMELYRLYDLARPGILGRVAHFKADFERPIAAASMDDATDDERLLGELAGQGLAAAAEKVRARPRASLSSIARARPTRIHGRCPISRQVQLRRRSSDLNRGLPDKHTLLIMCRPTHPQRELVRLLQPVTEGNALQCLGCIRTALLDPEVRPTVRPGQPARACVPTAAHATCPAAQALATTAFGAMKLRQVHVKSPERPAEKMGEHAAPRNPCHARRTLAVGAHFRSHAVGAHLACPRRPHSLVGQAAGVRSAARRHPPQPRGQGGGGGRSSECAAAHRRVRRSDVGGRSSRSAHAPGRREVGIAQVCH